MKTKEFNQVTTEKISVFGEVLEFIDSNAIEQIINKINKNSRLSGVLEEDEAKYEESNCSSEIIYHSSQINYSSFPCYDGSFKNYISKFLKSDQNRELNKLYEELIKEIQKMYHGYTHVETKLYAKINQYIQFADSTNNAPMEIISKLKEMSETLLDTIKFIELYLFKNFQILKKIFYKIDQRLKNNFDVESISLFFLLDIFDFPNNELSYMLMFKIIDEETCILKYITEILDNQVKNAEPKYNRIIENKEANSMDNEACLLDNKSTLSIEAYTAIANIKNKYLCKISEFINDIDSYSYFRAKYYNKYIYTKGNYEVDTNLFLNYIKEYTEDDNIEEFLPINSLMDEEVVINKFIQKSTIKKFLKFFYLQLPPSFRRSQKLIMLHTIQCNIISVFILFWYRNYLDGFVDILFFYLGRIISKIIFNYFLKKRRKIKDSLILSNVILIIGLIIAFISIGKSYYKWLIFGSRFLIGLSYSKNIETKFILNNIPKLLVKKTIKKYYSLIILSTSLGFFITSAFYYLLSFIEKKEQNIEKELNKKKLDINNVGEIIICLISFIILIINCVFFRETRYGDIVKIKRTNSLKKSSNKNLIQENEITANIPDNKDNKDNPEDKKDAASIFSYGKAKLISFKEKNKAKLLEESLKLDIGKKNYEGTNQIFNILQKLIIKENTSNSSYTNNATKGYILLYTLLYIIASLIIFFNPIFNSSKKNETNVIDSKLKIWIFGFPFLLSFFIYYFKLIRFSADIIIWNIIILIFILFEISLSIIFFLFDTKFFSKTPLYFDNYYLYGFLSFILFFNILIEMSSIKVMIRTIPIEKKISSINIDNFMDIYECIVKGLTFGLLFLVNYYSLMKKIIYIKIVIAILYILALVIFVLYNFKRNQISLIKIINKVTYESF